jgi:DNA ligase-1
MLSTSATRWPTGGDWVLQPKWDGFRLLIEIGKDGRPKAWSRHGANLTARVERLAAAFEETTRGSLFDGELVALSACDGRPVQDFALVCRAVLNGDARAAETLRFVAFDVLELAGEDLRARRWAERDQLLAEALPTSSLARRIESLPPTETTHAKLLALGFEGSILKRRASLYRPGRGRGWLKHKARLATDALLADVRQDRQGHWHAICNTDQRRIAAIAGPNDAGRIGEVVTVIYSRVDADGSLREARLPAD